jgi:hypothetical protein
VSHLAGRPGAGLALLLAAACGRAAPPAPAEEFWARLSGLCGQAFSGSVLEAPAGDTTFAGRTLTMHVRDCGADTIRIPFHVGENRSRTWVLVRSDSGLRLTHIHRHEDGVEDSVSRYGGAARLPGDPGALEFPADSFTAALIPAARTNVWRLELTPGEQFVYALRREGTDRRFRIAFDLTRAVAPPAP